MQQRATLSRITGGPKKRLALTAFAATLYASAIAASVPVARYDFSDFNSMYQDYQGLAKVTAVEQPIGLILDKSRGSARGAELVSGWQQGSTFPFDSFSTSGTGFVGSTATAKIGGAVVTVGTPIVPGKVYEATVVVNSATIAHSLRFSLGVTGAGGTESGTIPIGVTAVPVTVRGLLVTTATDAVARIQINNNGSFIGAIDIASVTVKEIPGTHLSQTTSTARPVVDARVNLMIQTEVLSNAVWTKTAAGTGTAPVITDNFGLAPDGTTTATRVQMALNGGTTVGDQCALSQGVTGLAAGVTISSGVWLKTNDGTTKLVQMRDDIATPAVGPILTVTGSWQFFSTENRVVQVGATGSSSVKLWLRGAQGTSDNADLLFWHPQLEIGSTLGRYQRVTTTTDYNAVGFPVTARFDGVDDCLFSLVNLDMTNTSKATVIAGVRKNSDAAFSVVVELGNALPVGSFLLAAPFSGSFSYGASARGSGIAFGTWTTTTFAAPHAAVLTESYDLASAAVLAPIRVNGTPNGAASATAGGGNFASYPLFVGRRNNASSPFNGKVATIDIIGRLVSPDEQYNLERQARQKLTGNTL